MAALTTPSRPIVVNDNAAQHTRASELPTPYNLQRNPKKKRTEPTPAASSSNQPGKTAARQNDDIATTAILNQLDEMERQARTKKQVIGDLARCLDSFVASYKGDHQRETRKQARGLVEMLVGHLNTAIFSASGGALYAPIRLMSSELTPTNKSPTASSRSPPAPLASALKQPGPPASKQVSWAEVAASNKGSSFGGASLRTGGTATSRKTSNPLQPGKEDPRILIRLGSERLQSRDSPFSLRNAIISEFGDLNLSLTDIPHIQPIKTGWAIKAGSKRVRELLLEPDNKVRLGRVMAAEAVEVPEHWYSYAVTQVPFSFPSYVTPGEVIQTSDVIRDEVYAQTQKHPVDVKPSRHGPDAHTGKGTWIVSFKEPVKPFRLFGNSGQARILDKKSPIELHNPGCQGYCVARRCNRVARCNHCGDRLEEHTDGAGPCTRPARCANCHGPYPAGHPDCAAAARRERGKVVRPTKKQLANIRRAGAKRYGDAATAAREEEEVAVQAQAQAQSQTRTNTASGTVNTTTPNDSLRATAPRAQSRKRGASQLNPGTRPHHTPSEATEDSITVSTASEAGGAAPEPVVIDVEMTDGPANRREPRRAAAAARTGWTQPHPTLD